jgi:dTDP-glucose pyrophosphorylase
MLESQLGAAPPRVGAILAAGAGSRMAPFSERYPKPLIPICNKPLIQRQLELLSSLGIREIVILIGHRGFEISKVLGDGRDLGVRLRYVEQTEMLGIAHAVGFLEPYIHEPFMLLLGDIFFVPRDLRVMFDLFSQQGGGAILACKEEDDPAAFRRNFSVLLDDSGYVKRVVEKPRYMTNSLKGVGLYLFDLTIFDAVRRTPRTAMRNEYEITDSIQVLIDDGQPVRVAKSIEDDINLTAPQDVLTVNLRQLAEMAESSLVGEECQLHPGVKLENSVIGSRVQILHPITVRKSVIFSEVEIQSKGAVENSVVAPNATVRCDGPTIARHAGPA